MAWALSAPLAAAEADSPPRLDGTWKWSFTMPDGSKLEPRVRLKVDGTQVTGTTRFRPDTDVAITNGVFQGDEVSFQVLREREGHRVTTTYRGRFRGNTIKGTMQSDWTGEMQSYPWEATRASADVSGTWQWTMGFREFRARMILKVKQEGEKLTGKVGAEGRRESDIKDGRIRKGEVTFSLERERDGIKSVTKYHGKLMDDTIEGTQETDTPGGVRSLPWKATRIADEAP
jgi:hypothetical protein